MAYLRKTRFWTLALLAGMLAYNPCCLKAQSLQTVTCTNDGNGLFSYTFTGAYDPFYWKFTPGDGGIAIQVYGAVETFQPTNWAATIDSNGVIYWYVTNGSVDLIAPFTLSVRSIYKAARTYDGVPGVDPFSVGVVYGTAWDGDRPFAVGYGTFPFTGPDPKVLPVLTIQTTGTNAVISWPGATNDFTLEYSANPFTPDNWTTVTNIPMMVGMNSVVTNDVSGTQFYRLRRTLGNME